MKTSYDAIIVGGGPNGLSAAIVLARAGLSVLLVEAKETLGGGARTAQLTLPGFHHDLCSAIHPTALLSPFFRGLDLQLDWIEPPAAVAHPFPDGSAAILEKSLDATAERLGEDGGAWRALMKPFLARGGELVDAILRPLLPPHRPFLMARFGLIALRSCRALVESRFEGPKARALFAGCSAHSVVPLHRVATASFGLVLALSAHQVGWPLVRGGSAVIIKALERIFRSSGGEVRLNEPVTRLEQLPTSRVVLFDVTPRQLLSIAGAHLPATYRSRLHRFRYGPGVFKIDWALDGPIPWKARECAEAGTVHLGGTFEEIAESEAAVWRGEHPERPFVLMAQQSLFDPTRAPAGKHTGWAYCHVPHGSNADLTETIERQVERFAPGFKDRILARSTITAADYQRHNENMIGGDIGGGANDLAQFLARPFFRLDPYSTPNQRIFLCSSSTPPGGGVHGMCGYWAARSVLRRVFGKRQEHAELL